MKKVLLLLVTSLYFISLVYSQSNKNLPSNETVFYYYKSQKLFFNVTYKQMVIGFAEGHSLNEVKDIIATEAKIRADSVKLTAVKNQYLIKLSELTSREKGKAIIEALKNNKLILYSRPCISGINGKLSSYGNDFVIKLKGNTSQMQLNSLLNQYGCKIVRGYMFDKATFVLSAGPSNGYDGLKMANIFFETGLFEYSEPDLEMYNAIDTPPNDPLYYLQWDHKNTGSAAQYNGVPGADMNVENAWKITKGKPAIKVAVIDEGVDTGHADLKSNLLQGFDCISLTSNKGDGRPLSGANAHGTCCAGIIAAISDNGIGIAGIAPKCKIIPVNLADASGYFTTNSNIAAGIDYAWMNGADVLTNSWGGGSPSSIIDDAIYRATTQGRGGKGCIVFFSAGNNNSGLSYPAINENVVAVGGINMCDKRKDPNTCDGENWWGASYGAGLGVVAPCVKIATTDISGSNGYSSDDYFATFNGTSAACPHVAAVAALILSVKNTLKQEDIKTIIENTADKISGYTFKSTTGYKNGTWNNEMGYGRVDAYNAVLAAQKDSFCSAEITSLGQTRFCTGGNVKLKVLQASGTASYTWYMNNTILSNTATIITAKKSGDYYVSATYANGCIASSAPITVTSVKSTQTLIADAGQNISLCKTTAGARIGGMPSASGGVAFLNEKRAYAMDWYTNNFYRFSLTNPSDADTIASNVVSASDLNSGYFFAGGDFTPFGYYALTRLTNKLIRIDTLNGSQQFIKTITPSSGEWTGLAWDPKGQQLYALSSFGSQSQLYTVDLINGDLQFVATIPLYYLIWISFDNEGTLFALSTNDRRIYSINKTTGAASGLPSVADAGLNYAQDADFDPVSDSLYLTAFTARQNYVGDLRIANTTTGTVSTVGVIGKTPFNELDATGIAGYTYKYNWSPANGLSDIYDANPIANPAKTTTYTLKVTDLCGNQATAQVKVIAKAVKPSVEITASKKIVCKGKKVRLSATANDDYLYQWYLDGVKIANATDSFYSAKTAGNYKVYVSLGLGGCGNTSKVFVLKDCNAFSFVSSDANANKTGAEKYNLYPNPATNVITITLPQSAKASMITVYDIEGKIVLRKDLHGNASTEQLNISKLAAGTYRVLWQQNEQQYTWKLIKQ